MCPRAAVRRARPEWAVQAEIGVSLLTHPQPESMLWTPAHMPLPRRAGGGLPAGGEARNPLGRIVKTAARASAYTAGQAACRTRTPVPADSPTAARGRQQIRDSRRLSTGLFPTYWSRPGAHLPHARAHHRAEHLAGRQRLALP